MSTIRDTFNGYDRKITIKCGTAAISKMNGELKSIDLSSPPGQVITVSKTKCTWPTDIQVCEAVGADGACKVNITAYCNCVVDRMTGCNCKWTVTPNNGVTSFSLTIQSIQSINNSWGDPGATVTIGEPPETGTYSG